MSAERWLPHPRLSVLLLIVWLLLHNTLSPGHVALGAVLAVAIPALGRGFWPERTPLHRPWLTLWLLGVVIWDIVTANLVVAVLILRPHRRLQPRFIELELALEDPVAITTLGSIISLTPGTVTVGVMPDRRRLLIHAMHATDAEALMRRIRDRYEAPLKEIFRC